MGARIPYGSGRAAIIDAAIRLVARDGLPKLSFRSLAAEAGVSLGAVRHSFPQINDVLSAALDHTMSESLALLDGATSIETLFDVMTEVIAKDRDRAAFEVKVMIEAQTTPELRELAQRYYAGFAAYLKNFLEERGLRSDDLLIEMLMVYADGVNYQRVVFGESRHKSIRQFAGLQMLAGELESRT